MSCGISHRCGLVLALLWLWRRPAAAAQIQSLAWELPYAVGMALKSLKKQKNKKKKNKKRKKLAVNAIHHLYFMLLLGELGTFVLAMDFPDSGRKMQRNHPFSSPFISISPLVRPFSQTHRASLEKDVSVGALINSNLVSTLSF